MFSVPQTASLSIENANGLDVGFDVAGALTLMNAHGIIGTLQVTKMRMTKARMMKMTMRYGSKLRRKHRCRRRRRHTSGPRRKCG